MKKKFPLLTALVIVLILMFIAVPSSSKASDLPFSEQEIETKRSCSVNGTKRTYYRLKNKHVYYQINNDDPMLLTSNAYRSGMDCYGSVWIILDEYSEEIFIGAYNYDLMGDLTFFFEYWDPNIPYDLITLDLSMMQSGLMRIKMGLLSVSRQRKERLILH